MTTQEYPAWLSGATIDYRREEGVDLIGRWNEHATWWHSRYTNECDPYSKVTKSEISPCASVTDRLGREYSGINMASQDYLSLATHTAVRQAATDAIMEYGVHSAGSAALMGNSHESVLLEQEVAAFLGMEDCTIFSTGWGAGYGLVKTLVRKQDHIVTDILSHACLQEGAINATANIHFFRHCSLDSLISKLKMIRAKESKAGILVITETLFSMDSDVSDIKSMQAICRDYQATLMIDVAHDLGALGPNGRGFLELQNVLGTIDIVMGSFSKTFASNGGFVACNNPALKLALRYNCGPLTFTNAITPVAARIVRKCIQIVSHDEGALRRKRLMDNILQLRNGLEAAGFELIGQPSPIVPVVIGNQMFSRLVTKHCLRLGGIINLVEYPAVSKNSCRWRLQVMANHTIDQIQQFIDIACSARELGKNELKCVSAIASKD